MQAGHSQGYELTTTALAVSFLDRFAATQYLQVKTSHWLLHGHDGQSQAKVSKDCLHVQNSASQQSRRFSTVDLKSLSDLLSCYLLFYHNVLWGFSRRQEASKHNQGCCLTECSCQTASSVRMDASLCGKKAHCLGDADHATSLPSHALPHAFPASANQTMAAATETGLTNFWCVQREECGFMWLAALAGLSLAAKLEEVGMPSTISALQVCGLRLCWEA